MKDFFGIVLLIMGALLAATACINWRNWLREIQLSAGRADARWTDVVAWPEYACTIATGVFVGTIGILLLVGPT